MNASPRAAINRISILLLVICAVAFGWERANNSGLKRTTGEVVAIRQVLAGKGGDGKLFTIHYQWQKEDYQLVIRRGILDSLGRLRELQRGDSVPLAVSPESPHRAVVDTITGRYGVTLCFVALTAIFAVVVLSLTVKGGGLKGVENNFPLGGPWGHSSVFRIIVESGEPWHAVRFCKTIGPAQRSYRSSISPEADAGKHWSLTGGGLRRWLLFTPVRTNHPVPRNIPFPHRTGGSTSPRANLQMECRVGCYARNRPLRDHRCTWYRGFQSGTFSFLPLGPPIVDPFRIRKHVLVWVIATTFCYAMYSPLHYCQVWALSNGNTLGPPTLAIAVNLSKAARPQSGSGLANRKTPWQKSHN